MRRVLTFLAVLLAAFVGFAQFVRRTSMFFPERFPAGDWNVAGARDEWMTTRDGVRLHGWLFAAADPHAPLVVFFHGNGGNIAMRAPIGIELARRGVSVLLFDWRGYGKSDGTPSESALFDDADAAYALAATLAPRDRIAMYGESLGGPYAAWTAKRHGARCVVIDSSFPSLRELGDALYAPVPIGWTAPFALRTRTWLNEAKAPVLVMHSRNDNVIPFRLGKSLYDGLRVPKQMIVSDVRGHCELSIDPNAHYYDVVARFIQSPPAQ